MYKVEYDIDKIKLNDGDVILISSSIDYKKSYYNMFYIVQYVDSEIKLLNISGSYKTTNAMYEKNTADIFKNCIISCIYFGDRYRLESLSEIYDRNNYTINRIEQKFLIDKLEQNIECLNDEISNINENIEYLKIMKQTAIKNSLINEKI